LTCPEDGGTGETNPDLASVLLVVALVELLVDRR
jgi:hypothetical protein